MDFGELSSDDDDYNTNISDDYWKWMMEHRNDEYMEHLEWMMEHQGRRFRDRRWEIDLKIMKVRDKRDQIINLIDKLFNQVWTFHILIQSNLE